jgi:hypothetical protein
MRSAPLPERERNVLIVPFVVILRSEATKDLGTEQESHAPKSLLLEEKVAGEA